MERTDIHRIRRFNRAVTSALGVLDESFLGRGRPLGVARVLNAIGHGMTDVADLRDYVDLDSGLLSRILRRLETEGLVEVTADLQDKRKRVVDLTPTGKAEFDAYEKLSDTQAERLLNGHKRPNAVLEAMDFVATALRVSNIVIETVDPRSSAALQCLEAYYGELNRRFDGGFDVNLSRDPDAQDMLAPRGAFLVATSDGSALGCVGLKGTDKPWAEIKRLWVSPAARGTGLAQRLMADVETQARTLGFAKLRLDTNSALPEAARLYDRLGWHQIPRFNDDPYPDLFFEKEL